MKSFWSRTDELPPILIRLLARRKKWGAPLSTLEIAERSGLSPVMVESMSIATDWTGIDIPTARAFCLACRVDLCDYRTTRRIDDYLRKSPTWQHLRKSPLWDSYYEPLMLRYIQSILKPKKIQEQQKGIENRTL